MPVIGGVRVRLGLRLVGQVDGRDNHRLAGHCPACLVQPAHHGAVGDADLLGHPVVEPPLDARRDEERRRRAGSILVVDQELHEPGGGVRVVHREYRAADRRAVGALLPETALASGHRHVADGILGKGVFGFVVVRVLEPGDGRPLVVVVKPESVFCHSLEGVVVHGLVTTTGTMPTWCLSACATDICDRR